MLAGAPLAGSNYPAKGYYHFPDLRFGNKWIIPSTDSSLGNILKIVGNSCILLLFNFIPFNALNSVILSGIWSILHELMSIFERVRFFRESKSNKDQSVQSYCLKVKLIKTKAGDR